MYVAYHHPMFCLIYAFLSTCFGIYVFHIHSQSQHLRFIVSDLDSCTPAKALSLTTGGSSTIPNVPRTFKWLVSFAPSSLYLSTHLFPLPPSISLPPVPSGILVSDLRVDLRIQVNEKIRKFETKYRDCIKRNRDKIGTQTCYEIST